MTEKQKDIWNTFELAIEDNNNQQGSTFYINCLDGYYVDDAVDAFEAWGLGVYLYNRDASVELDTAMEVPDKNGVKVHNICTVMLTGYPGMNHIINESGDSVTFAGERKVICEYEKGLIR